MVLSRRSVLRTLGTGLATASVSSLVWTGRARASDLALSDRIDLLYSNQFHFNARGEPQITVGLMTGQTEVELSAPEVVGLGTAVVVDVVASTPVLPGKEVESAEVVSGSPVPVEPMASVVESSSTAGPQPRHVTKQTNVAKRKVMNLRLEGPAPTYQRWFLNGIDQDP